MIEGLTITPALDRHSFRGQFLDCFAQIERHLGPAIVRLVQRGHKKKAPLLFGLKFELVLASIEIDGLWQHRHHVKPILTELSPFAAMRGLICHGLIDDSAVLNKPAFAITLPCVEGPVERIVLTVAECSEIIRDLRKLTDRILRQRLAGEFNPPSSPPPPSPASTIDP